MLKEIITKWLGEEKNKCNHNISQEDGYCYLCFSIKLNESHFDNGYNQALQDLKSRIPELEEMILGEIESNKLKEPLYIGQTQYEFYKGNVDWVYNSALDDIKNTLKGVK